MAGNVLGRRFFGWIPSNYMFLNVKICKVNGRYLYLSIKNKLIENSSTSITRSSA